MVLDCYASFRLVRQISVQDTGKRRELTQQDLKVLSSIKGQSYDLVLNGVELGGGSIRVHDSAIQKSIFSLLGSYEQTELGRFTKKQPPPKTGAQGKIGSAKQQADGESADPVFGHLLTALEYGCPPHGGVAIGLDRYVLSTSHMHTHALSHTHTYTHTHTKHAHTKYT